MALKIFLKLDGIQGESTDKKHKDEIDVRSWTWGMVQQLFHDGGGGGTSAGKAKFEDLQFSHRIDKASPAIMLACASGKHLKDATLTMRKAGKTPLEFLVIKLMGVLVTSVRDAGDEGMPGTHETVTLNFAKVDLEYVPQKASGAPGAGVHFKWDVQANQKI